MLTIPEDVTAVLLKRYKKATRADINAIIRSTERWLFQNVHGIHLLPGNMPVEFNAIPILQVHVAFGPRCSRNGGTFGSWDLIAPYRKM